MRRAVVLSTVFALGIVVGASVATQTGGGAQVRIVASAAASRSTEPFVPACPGPSYTTDGNITPLFCKIDNPVALHFYAPLSKHLFALGANATPEQVTSALRADLKHGGTQVELCYAYELSAWRWGWHFASDPAAFIYC
jgi:hypothetical protein